MGRPARTDQISRTRMFALTALAALVATLALAAPEAEADCGAPSISGDEQVGSTLTATAGTCTGFPPNVTLQWYRCTGTTSASCTTPVKAAQSSPSAYTPTAADVGAYLGVRQVATIAPIVPPEEDWALTRDVVAQPPSPPPPPPPPDGGSAAPLLSPFPVVTIAGRIIRRGARITRLGVTAPSGSNVLVRCRGRGCRPRSARVTVGPSGAVRLRRFQRRLRAGTVLELLITKPGFVGKYTRFRIRRRRPPLRTDLCVQPGATTGSACPA